MQSVFGSIIDGWYNFRYYLTSYIYDNTKQLRQQQKIYILNHAIEGDIEIEERINRLKNIFENTIWFTYRCKFPSLEQTTYTSDTGWGCMLRVGQMAIAQIIKEHYNLIEPEQLIVLLRNFIDNDDLEVSKFKVHLNGIDESQDYYHAPFSIQKIAAYAAKEFKMKPGQWYNPNQILYVLQYLHQFSQYSINLKIHINADNAFILFDIIDTMTGQARGKENKALLENQEKIQQHGVAIYILTRIGLESCNRDYLQILNKLMTSKYFQGILGGSPNHAYYIFGRVGDYYIYLDPHYVQTAQSFQELSHNQDTYSCKNIQLIHHKYLDPSMAIGFYVRNIEELMNLWKELNEIKKEYPDQFFMALAESFNSTYLSQYNEQDGDDDESFTIIQ